MQPGTVESPVGLVDRGAPLRLVWAWWALVALYLVRLGAAPLFDVDEGAFAEATREMLARGDWGHTFLNGADRFDKPILVYWFQAIAMLALGVNEFAARLPSALWTLFAAWQAGQFLRPRWGESQAALAMFLGGSALGVVAIGRAATADGLLNALIVLTALRLWAFAETGDKRALMWAYFWCALGLLAKGPVAVLVPGGALFWWSVFTDRGRSAWRAIWAPRGWLLLLLVAAPWYVYALHRHGHAFIDGFILKHNVERFSSAMEGHGGGLAYYLIAWPLLCLPWTPLMGAVMAQARAIWRDTFARFLLVWALWVLVFFSLSGTKLPHYLLYGTAPMLWLMARSWLLHHQAARRVWLVWLALLTAASALAWGASPWLVQHWADQIAHAGYRELLGHAPAPQWGVAALAFSVGAGLLAWCWRPWSMGLRAVVSGALALAGFTTAALPWWGDALQGPVKTAGLLLRTRAQAATQWQTHQPSIGFYAQAEVPRRAPQAGEWALTKAAKGEVPPGYEVAWQKLDVRLIRKVAP